MQHHSFTISLIALLLAATTAAAAQAPAGHLMPAPSGSAADVPAPDSNRVSIDVQVTDKLGHPITGLQPQNFTLLDNRQPTKILELRDIESHAAAADPIRVIIVVDMINTRFDVVARARQQLDDFLLQDGGHLAHPTSLALLTEKGLKIEKQPVTDGKVLAASIDKSDTILRFEGQSAGFYGAEDRLNWSLSQLTELAAYESTQPGRKFAFFLSPGWPLLSYAGIDESSKQREWVFQSIVHLTNGLRESHMTVYTIDPFQFGHGNPYYYQSYLKGVSKPSNAEYPELGLQVLATHTGGLVQVRGIDIKGGINTAIRDASSYYALTFDAPTAAHANEYHDLHLELDKPGASVRTTTGYYANTDTAAKP